MNARKTVFFHHFLMIIAIAFLAFKLFRGFSFMFLTELAFVLALIRLTAVCFQFPV
jgi:hypothetical protein